MKPLGRVLTQSDWCLYKKKKSRHQKTAELGTHMQNKRSCGIKIARRNINNLRHADDTTLIAESEEELKGLLRVKEESEKADLKLNILKTKIMASSPITSWQIDWGKVETVANFIFLGSKMTGMVTAVKSNEILPTS